MSAQEGAVGVALGEVKRRSGKEEEAEEEKCGEKWMTSAGVSNGYCCRKNAINSRKIGRNYKMEEGGCI